MDRALMFSPILPSRSGHGLAMRMALFVEALEQICKLDVVVLPVAGNAPCATTFKPDTNISIWDVEPETHFRLLSLIEDEGQRLVAFKDYRKPSLSSGISERILRRANKLVSANRYRVIHVARSYMLPILDGLDADAPVTVDLDEDDYEATMSAAHLAAESGSCFRARRLAEEAHAFDRMIATYSHRFATCFASNEIDRGSLMSRHKGLKILPAPNGVAVPRPVPKRDDGRTIGFVGTLGYPPNLDGVTWFCDCVLPRIRSRRAAGLQLCIASANIPAGALRLGAHPRVRLSSRVTDVGAFYRSTTIAIAPMRMGGGLRTKIIEAGAYGTAYVSAPGNIPKSHLKGRPAGWIARGAAEFAQACIEALENTAERERRGSEGRRVAASLYNRERIVSDLKHRFRELIGKGERSDGSQL
ncbi:MAG TPA: glycosyltransferase [Methylovirgula sp.]|nr:glycosyltransferase [Methylovirgula sp.]